MNRVLRVFCLAAAMSLLVLAFCPTTTVGQTPLIDDSSLIFYLPGEPGDFTIDNPMADYSLGESYGTLADRSGNGFDGTVYIPQQFGSSGTFDFTIDTGITKRGGGSIHIDQTDFTGQEDAVYVDLHGTDLYYNNPAMTAAATDSVTYAAWVYVPSTTGYHTGSIFQGRGSGPNGGSGHGGPHFQLESDGRLRMVNRDSDGNAVVNAPDGGKWHPDTGDAAVGGQYPLDEWFHVAMTVDHASGTYAMYYNGVQKVTGATEGTQELGDWGGRTPTSPIAGTDAFGFGFGRVYDSPTSRNFEGYLDEMYVYNRSLSPAEIMTLYTFVVPTLDGDVNGDGWVDGLDYLAWAGNFGAHPGPDGDVSDGDLNDDGWVDGLDYLIWAGNFGNHSASAVPEPSTLMLVGIGLSLVGMRRRKK